MRHDCAREGCKEDGEEFEIHEGQRSQDARPVVRHIGNSSAVVLNLFVLRNYAELRDFHPTWQPWDSDMHVAKVVAKSQRRIQAVKDAVKRRRNMQMSDDELSDDEL